MNDDELENQLRSTPLRRAPDEWRAEILDVPVAEPRDSFFDLIVRWISIRPGWSAICALWLVSLLLRAVAPSVDSESSTATEARSVSPQMILHVWNDHFKHSTNLPPA